MPTRAFDELTGLLLDAEDRQKLEWVIGAILSDEPPNFVIVKGGRESGKTTLLQIVRKVVLAPRGELGFIPHLAFIHDDRDLEADGNTNVFFETNEDHPDLEERAIVLTTTGDQIPVNKHYVLMQTVDNEVASIARRCCQTFESLGYNYYDSF